MMKSNFLYIAGIIIIILGALLIAASGFTGNYGVSIIVFPIPFVFTFGKPASFVSTLTVIMSTVMVALFVIYIITIIIYSRRWHNSV